MAAAAWLPPASTASRGSSRPRRHDARRGPQAGTRNARGAAPRQQSGTPHLRHGPADLGRPAFCGCARRARHVYSVQRRVLCDAAAARHCPERASSSRSAASALPRRIAPPLNAAARCRSSCRLAASASRQMRSSAPSSRRSIGKRDRRRTSSRTARPTYVKPSRSSR